MCIVRVPAARLHPALADLRGDLGQLDGVRLHPDHFLHITLQELGFVVDAPTRTDEITPQRLEEFAQAAVDPISGAAAFHIALAGANSFQDAVFLGLRGGSPLVQIHKRLFDLAAIPRPPVYPYLPHCTVAHYDGSLFPRTASQRIGPWREVVFGELTVAEVEIVTIDSSRPYPELESYAVIPLAE
jgi:2'-5' RNA ligase